MERKIIMMLVAVVVVIRVCVYFMMNNELNQATFTNTHAQIFSTGLGGASAPNAASKATTYLDPTRKIVSFGPNGDIDHSLTLGDIMQNAYYFAAKAYLAAKQDINTAFNNAGISTTTQNQYINEKINKLNLNVRYLNGALLGSTGNTNTTTGAVIPPTALLQPAYATSQLDQRYTRKNVLYKIIVGPTQPTAGQSLTMDWNWSGGSNEWTGYVPKASGGTTSNAKFKFID